jgi:hypothetical protein
MDTQFRKAKSLTTRITLALVTFLFLVGPVATVQADDIEWGKKMIKEGMEMVEKGLKMKMEAEKMIMDGKMKIMKGEMKMKGIWTE